MTTGTSMSDTISPETRAAHHAKGLPSTRARRKSDEIPIRKAIVKAVTWRLIGTAEIFAICFWTTGQIATAGHTAALAAVTSIVMYVVHELAWHWHEGRAEMMSLSSCRASARSPARERHVCEAHPGGSANPVEWRAVLVTFNHGIADAAEGFSNQRRGRLSPQAHEPVP
jgi:uncharacterized membrane protein